MSQPTRFVPNSDYSADVSPGDLGNALDPDFDDLQLTTDEICDNLALIQKDDGTLVNGIVTPDSFSAAAAAMVGNWLPRGAWVTATAYSPFDFVTQSGISYVCIVAHVSGVFSTDLAAGKWTAISKVDTVTTPFSLSMLGLASAFGWLNSLGFSVFMQSLVDDADAATARTTLGTQSIAESFSQIITIIAAQYGAKGDQVFGTSFHGSATKPIGANGTIRMARSAETLGVADVPALTKAIYGFTYKNNSGDATNDIDVFSGGCMDSTGAYWIGELTLGFFTKQLDAAWAAGNAAGGLDTGSIGNSDYYIWAIARSDTGVTDILFSLSSTAPTMPPNYDFKRLIGWFKRVGGTIVPFITYESDGGGLDFLWSAPTLDINLLNTLTTSRRTDAVKVPLNFSVIANLNVQISDASAGSINIIYCPDQADLTPSASTLNLSNNVSTTALQGVHNMHVRTSAAGLIAARSNLATVDAYLVSTMGFHWSRRN